MRNLDLKRTLGIYLSNHVADTCTLLYFFHLKERGRLDACIAKFSWDDYVFEEG